ncbi:rod shape-determining protein RodA [Bacteroidia bacterium]|nr:rod shape-determining protein RodA [Bacteroidia bacterium]
MNNDYRIAKNMDVWLILVYVVLVICGWFNIYATVNTDQQASIFNVSQIYGKQMIFIIMAFVIAAIILLVDMRFFMNMSYIFYAIVLVLLVAVTLFGTKISGARSWFTFGGFSIQPSEFAKFTTCLALAKYLSTSVVVLKDIRSQLIAMFIMLFPATLILLQPDMGSAMIFGCFILALYREGLPAIYLWVIFFAAVLFVAALLVQWYIILIVLAIAVSLLIFINKRTFKNIAMALLLFLGAAAYTYSADYAFQKLQTHQQDRIKILFAQEIDTQGVGYNVSQSKIAIGSGGWTGKGFMQGTQTKYNFVPEQSTDFIFCTIGEEWGFVGSVLLLVLFFILIQRIVALAEQSRNKFSRIYGYGLASLLFFQVFINVGMTIGLLPVIGIPLPFFSYGGSSLWTYTIMLFVFIKQSASKSMF